MAIANKILKIRDHSLSIDPLWVVNTETADNESGYPDDKTIKSSETVGDLEPLIEINGYKFLRHEIGFVELDESDTIPKISVSVKDPTGSFTNKYFPQSQCLLKLYLKAADPNLKSVRCDFIITEISNSGSENPDGGALGVGNTYFISGIMNIPKMFQNTSACYNSSSYNALFDISKKLDIGFATNEISTNDKMCWIQPNINYESMIKNISLRAYKNEGSFFSTFVDRYYNLTFVNMGNMTAVGDTDDIAFNTASNYKDYIASGSTGTTDKGASVHSKLMLSNFMGFKGTPSFIKSFSIESERGSSMIYNPDTKNVYYYDIQQSQNVNERFVNYFVKPINQSVESTDEISNNYINVWEGLETGNVHDNYIFSKSNNIQNIVDLTKSTMKIISEGVNLNIIRGMRIPVLIFKMPAISQTCQPQDSELAKDEIEITKSDEDPIPDVKLSAYYVVNKMRIVYNPNREGTNNGFYTELECVRNNWAQNDKLVKE